MLATKEYNLTNFNEDLQSLTPAEPETLRCFYIGQIDTGERVVKFFRKLSKEQLGMTGIQSITRHSGGEEGFFYKVTIADSGQYRSFLQEKAETTEHRKKRKLSQPPSTATVVPPAGTSEYSFANFLKDLQNKTPTHLPVIRCFYIEQKNTGERLAEFFEKLSKEQQGMTSIQSITSLEGGAEGEYYKITITDSDKYRSFLQEKAETTELPTTNYSVSREAETTEHRKKRKLSQPPSTATVVPPAGTSEYNFANFLKDLQNKTPTHLPVIRCFYIEQKNTGERLAEFFEKLSKEQQGMTGIRLITRLEGGAEGEYYKITITDSDKYRSFLQEEVETIDLSTTDYSAIVRHLMSKTKNKDEDDGNPLAAGIIDKFRSVAYWAHKNAESKSKMDELWKNYKLRNWCLGLEVDGQIIRQKAICDIFMSILSSRRQNIIMDMWNNSQMLRDTIKSLESSNIGESKKLLHKVIQSSCNGKSPFIDQYLNFLDSDKIVEDVLNDQEKKSYNGESHYLYNQISSLEDRLAAMRRGRGSDNLREHTVPPQIIPNPDAAQREKTSQQSLVTGLNSLFSSSQIDTDNNNDNNTKNVDYTQLSCFLD